MEMPSNGFHVGALFAGKGQRDVEAVRPVVGHSRIHERSNVTSRECGEAERADDSGEVMTEEEYGDV